VGDAGAAEGPRPPLPLFAPVPVYPDAAKRARREGTVVVRLTVDERGLVESADVVAGAAPDLDAAALDAARTLRFQPALVDGRPSRATIDWRVRFALPPEPGGTPSASPAAAPPRAPVPTTPLALEVRSRGSHRAVPGAVVRVDGATAGESDAEGRFVGAVSPGPHHVQLDAPGHEPLSLRLRGGGDAPVIVRLVPLPASVRRYETIIEAGPEQAPRRTLAADELTKTAGSLGDPFRVIESLPGVSPVVWPAPVYAVRGSNPGNTGYFLDDVRVPALFHFALGPAVVHPYFLDQLDFYPGAYPARLGRYVGGAVDATLRRPERDAAHGSIDVRLFDAGGVITAPLPGGRGAIAAAGRYAYTAGLLSALSQDLELHYWDYQARIDHELAGGRVVLTAFGSYDRFKVEDEGALTLTFHRVDLRHLRPLGAGRLSVSLTGGFDRTALPHEEGGGPGARAEEPFHVRALNVTPRVQVSHPLGRGAAIEIGGDAELQRFDTEIPARLGADGDLGRSRDVAALGAHVATPLRLGRLALVPALRVDAYFEQGTRAVDVGPRLAARLQVAEALVLKASGGRFTQLPSLPVQIPGWADFGLRSFGLQSSWVGAAGAEAPLPFDLTVDLTGFVQRFVLSDLRDVESGDPLLESFFVRRHALSYGAELMIRRPVDARLYGWLSYTLSWAKRAYEGGVVAASDYDQRHVLNLVAGWRVGRYAFGGRLHLHTGRPVKISGREPTDYGRLPPFTQLDLRAERRFVFDAHTIEIYLELVNATLSRQVVGLNDYAGRIERESFRLVLPSLGARATFSGGGRAARPCLLRCRSCGRALSALLIEVVGDDATNLRDGEPFVIPYDVLDDAG
jgi:TonB family protein